jgi:formamidopyrimidine-DNA glycosylase
MPELPEIEAIARSLRPLVSGKTIRRCRVIHAIAVRPSSGRGAKRAAAALERRLRARRIRRVSRRGKYLLFELNRGNVVLHFRLSGQLVWFDSGISGHVDVAFEFGTGALGFVDRRHLGRVQWLAAPEDLPGIRGLGVDPLSAAFTAERLEKILSGSKRPLKLVLLDQERVAGLGNTYSCEALWHARLDPRRLAHRIKPAETRRLHKAIVEVLRRALKCCLHPAPDFRDPDWWFQGLEDILRVYGREGKPCRRCGAPIRRLPQGGRSTFACVRCQK